MTLTDEERCRAVCTKFGAAGFYKLLGMIPSSDGPGTSRVVLPFRAELVQLYGAVHGGAVLAMADAAVNLALATTLEENENTSTVDISLSFLAPPGPRNLEARGTLTKRGRKVSFAECTVVAGADHEVIARAKAVLYIR